MYQWLRQGNRTQMKGLDYGLPYNFPTITDKVRVKQRSLKGTCTAHYFATLVGSLLTFFNLRHVVVTTCFVGSHQLFQDRLHKVSRGKNRAL